MLVYYNTFCFTIMFEATRIYGVFFFFFPNLSLDIPFVHALFIVVVLYFYSQFLLALLASTAYRVAINKQIYKNIVNKCTWENYLAH